MLNSSGGFSISTSSVSSPISDKTPSSSRSSQRPSDTSVFFVGDEDTSSRSFRSASYSNDRPTSSSDDPLSPVFQNEQFPPTNNSSSLQQHSPAIIRTAPLYISMYSSSPPIPIVKNTVSSSAPPTNDNNDNQSFFTRRSPSPQSTSVLKKKS